MQERIEVEVKKRPSRFGYAPNVSLCKLPSVSNISASETKTSSVDYISIFLLLS